MKIRREDLKDLLPLTPMQEGLLFHARHDPSAPAYTEQVVWRVRGAFDAARYHEAWDAIHERYDVLRSVFTHEKSVEPRQMILKARAADVTFESLLPLSPAVREQCLVDARQAERARPFDLAGGPLLRVRVYQVDEADHEIVLTWHHILLDGWSTHLVLRDLFAIYESRLSGVDASLPPVPSYAPYVEWLRSANRDASLAYWAQLLDGYEAAAEIPFPIPRGDAPYALERADFRLDAEEQRALQSLAAERNATLSSIVQAAWGIVLGRYGDTTDVVFGAVVSGRSPDVPDIERVAGLLINTIPVRVRYNDGDTFGDLVARVQQQSVESQPHHASRLAAIQNRSELRAGLIRHLVVFENYPVERVHDGDDVSARSIRVVETHEPTTYDLVLVVVPGARLHVELQFNASVYAHAQMTALAGHLQRLLAAAARRPSSAIATLEMLDAAERRHLVHDLNQTTRDYPSGLTLADVFAATASVHAARSAINSDGAAVSYEDLDRRSNQLAHHLAALGVSAGDRVVTVLERSPALIEAILAILKLGASYVPIDPATPVDRLAVLVQDAGAKAICTMLASDVNVAGVLRVALDAEAPAIAARPTIPPSVTATRGGEDEAVLYYTSGSTGTPKGVVMPHRALLRLVLNTNYVQFGPDDRVAHMSNVAFDAASFEIWGALLNGAELHPLMRDTALTPAVLRRELRARGITVMFVTSALFNQIAREAPDAFATVDTVIVGGDRAEPKWVKRVLARGTPKRLLNGYGPTETGTFATWHLITSADENGTVPIGQPIGNTTAFVVDRHLQLQPLMASGELLIGGDGVALGYHHRPELTAASFIPDPVGGSGGTVYRTGDVVRRNLDGDLEFIGRRDSQVKLRGFRIEPGEIEAAILTFAGVTGALVLAHRDEASGDHRLAAYVALPSAARTIELELRNYLRSRLPGYMIPSTFVVLDRFPLNANGKIDRAALPAPSRSGMGFARTFVEPATDLERQIAAIWQTTLGSARVGRQDNFFELGGHSLTASTAVSRIRAELKVEVPIALFFEAPTLEALALIVAERQRTAAAAPQPLTRIAREVQRR